MTLVERFDAVHDEFLKFERIENKRNTRSDMHAFLLIDELMPGTDDIVCSCEYDQIYLAGDLEEINDIITDEQVLELVRCGVMISDDSLSMFV
jgi:hypothetical protein